MADGTIRGTGQMAQLKTAPASNADQAYAVEKITLACRLWLWIYNILKKKLIDLLKRLDTDCDIKAIADLKQSDVEAGFFPSTSALSIGLIGGSCSGPFHGFTSPV